MTTAPQPVQVFIGSSSEGLRIARTLQSELESATDCTVNRWDTDTFAPGSFTLDALLQQANTVDFAILVATGDDTITSRGAQVAAVRDNIILELGIFLGALGRERVYLLGVGDAKLPSDLLGLTRLNYRERQDGDIRAGLTDAVVRAERAIEKLGPYAREALSSGSLNGSAAVTRLAREVPEDAHGAEAPDRQSRLPVPEEAPGKDLLDPGRVTLATVHAEHALNALEEEIQWLCSNARNQGWSVIKSNRTTLRLESPKGHHFTLTRQRPASTRAELRRFVAELKANGLRVNQALQSPVENSPFG